MNSSADHWDEFRWAAIVLAVSGGIAGALILLSWAVPACVALVLGALAGCERLLRATRSAMPAQVRLAAAFSAVAVASLVFCVLVLLNPAMAHTSGH